MRPCACFCTEFKASCLFSWSGLVFWRRIRFSSVAKQPEVVALRCELAALGRDRRGPFPFGKIGVVKGSGEMGLSTPAISPRSELSLGFCRRKYIRVRKFDRLVSRHRCDKSECPRVSLCSTLPTLTAKSQARETNDVSPHQPVGKGASRRPSGRPQCEQGKLGVVRL